MSKLFKRGVWQFFLMILYSCVNSRNKSLLLEKKDVFSSLAHVSSSLVVLQEPMPMREILPEDPNVKKANLFTVPLVGCETPPFTLNFLSKKIDNKDGKNESEIVFPIFDSKQNKHISSIVNQRIEKFISYRFNYFWTEALDSINPTEQRMTCENTMSAGRFLSIDCERYEDYGGAHPNHKRSTLNLVACNEILEVQMKSLCDRSCWPKLSREIVNFYRKTEDFEDKKQAWEGILGGGERLEEIIYNMPFSFAPDHMMVYLTNEYPFATAAWGPIKLSYAQADKIFSNSKEYRYIREQMRTVSRKRK